MCLINVTFLHLYSRSVVSESLLLVEYFLLFFLLSICQGEAGRQGEGQKREGGEREHVREKFTMENKCYRIY